MKVISVIDGPLINVFGWLTAPDCLPVISVPGVGESPAAPCTFNASSDVILQDGIERGVVDVPFAIRKKSGVARSRSASKATIFASMLGTEFIKYCRASGEDIGIACVSSSSTLPIAWEFESAGVRDGWNETDTMLLPSSIPSAISTQIAAAHNLHATALTFLDGMMGACSALEYSALCFHYQRAQEILLLCAEEVSPPHQIAAEHINYTHAGLLFNGASGIVLSAPTQKATGWQFKIIHRYSPKEQTEFPPEWRTDRDYYEMVLKSELTAFTSWLLPLFIHQAVSEAKSHKIIVKCGHENLGGFILGLEWKE
ncbi:hypothetical protein IW01_14670 [Pectobacterium brasiliense]|uniref:hypothetical protein n=1 Tax=Pectobacterium brasiliense TaxID=180957 RepID=UPI0004E659DE|nr:hypothetical protein [Pectobacterium brasiliense]KFF67589.1 hypothetical protein IW01_14670 [Pectobacterium brasiliense]